MSSTQNAAQRCSASTNGITVLSFHAVGYALIVDDSKKTINHNERYANIGETPTDNDRGFLLFPSAVEFQYSLFHPICNLVTFPVLNHALTHMEQPGLFAILYPRGIFGFVKTKGNPTVQAFCKYSVRFMHR
jgi:hypothetical protein